MKKPEILFICLLCVTPMLAQQRLSTDEAVKTALASNGWSKAAEMQLNEAQAMRKTASDLGNFSVLWMSGQYNSLRTDNNFTFMQTLPLPALIAAKAKLGKAREEGARAQMQAVRQTIELSVREVCDQLLYLQANNLLLLSQDSIFRDAAQAAAVRYRTGEGTLLEKMTAETQALEAGNQVQRNAAEMLVQESKLRALMRADGFVQLDGRLARLSLPASPDTGSVRWNPRYLSATWNARAGRFETQVERRSLLPSVTLGYFNQTLIGYQKIGATETFYGADKRFSGFQLGLSMPLWARPQLARAQAAGWRQQALEAEAGQVGHQLRSELDQAVQEWMKATASLDYYEQSANANAELILKQARTAYRKGELSYTSYLQSLQSALSIRGGYLLTLRQYNQSVLQILYLTGRFGQ